MTTISMHGASAPVFLTQLNALLAWLDKAQAHAQARKFNPDNYLGCRLAPDMLPLVSQVRIASDAAKGCMARLAGQAAPLSSVDVEPQALQAALRAAIDDEVHAAFEAERAAMGGDTAAAVRDAVDAAFSKHDAQTSGVQLTANINSARVVGAGDARFARGTRICGWRRRPWIATCRC